MNILEIISSIKILRQTYINWLSITGNIALYKLGLKKRDKITGILRNNTIISGEYYKLLEIGFVIEKLNQLGITITFKENIIEIILPFTTLKIKNENDLNILSNLFSLIYFVIKYGSTIDGLASAFYKSGKSEERVKSYSLSSLLDKLGVEEVDYLKMDCKGCERYLSPSDLKRIKQIAKIETTLNNVNELGEIVKRIKEAGFKKTYIIYHNPEFYTNIFLHSTVYAIR